MNALTDGFGGTHEPRTHLVILLSVVLAVVVIAVLAAALIRVRRGLESASRRPWPRSPARSRASRPSTCARSSRL